MKIEEVDISEFLIYLGIDSSCQIVEANAIRIIWAQGKITDTYKIVNYVATCEEAARIKHTKICALSQMRLS